MKARWKTHLTLSRLQTELENLRSDNQFRRLGSVSGVNLCSNDYLALSRDSRLKGVIRSALDQDTLVSSTGSRLLSGHHDAWDVTEAKLASFVGAEASVYFSSGYMANLGLFT